MTAMTVLLGLGAGCNRTSPVERALPGMEARSHDGALHYSIIGSRDVVVVKNADTGAVIAEIPVGKAPEQLLVGPGDTLYVTNRGSRSVSVIHRGEWREAERIAVGVEPVGLALSPDNRTLYVVNSGSFESADAGTLTAVDLESGDARWEIPLGEDPRKVTVQGNTAEVVKKGGRKVKVDLKNRRVIEEPKPKPPEPQLEAPRASAGEHGTPATGTIATIVR